MKTLATIGFAGKSLQQFVEALRGARVQKVIDTRLRPNSQFSAFARARDLVYLLPEYEHIAYEHCSDLAPTRELLAAYRKGGAWSEYEAGFAALMEERDMLEVLATSAGTAGVVALLCSEASADQCHRRLLAEAYAARHGVEVRHL